MPDIGLCALAIFEPDVQVGTLIIPIYLTRRKVRRRVFE